jgi:hypothetical protein
VSAGWALLNTQGDWDRTRRRMRDYCLCASHVFLLSLLQVQVKSEMFDANRHFETSVEPRFKGLVPGNARLAWEKRHEARPILTLRQYVNLR